STSTYHLRQPRINQKKRTPTPAANATSNALPNPGQPPPAIISLAPCPKRIPKTIAPTLIVIGPGFFSTSHLQVEPRILSLAHRADFQREAAGKLVETTDAGGDCSCGHAG